MDGESIEPNLHDHLKSLAEYFEQRASDEFGIAPGQHNVSIADGTVDEEWVGVGSAFMVALNREKHFRANQEASQSTDEVVLKGAGTLGEVLGSDEVASRWLKNRDINNAMHGALSREAINRRRSRIAMKIRVVGRVLDQLPPDEGDPLREELKKSRASMNRSLRRVTRRPPI